MSRQPPKEKTEQEDRDEEDFMFDPDINENEDEQPDFRFYDPDNPFKD
jgi:hypothetical protein